MNKDKQDIFYSQARNVLNYNVKRLWFKLNPFLETKSKDENDLPNKFIQPQQSTVLCEKLHFNGHIDRSEQGVPVGEFWDFLYSDKWDHGCSIRILEGQLYDYLQTKLNVLLRKQTIVQHRTFAFARNKREKRGCYKLANEKGCGEIEEILLLEFVYYGRKVEPVRPYGSTCSSYPGTSTTTSGTTPRKSPPASDAEEEYYPLIRRVSIESRTLSQALPPVKRADFTGKKPLKGKKATTTRARSNSLERGKYEVKAINQQFEIIPKQISAASSESDYRSQPPVLNLKQFRCTEKVVYGDNLDTICEEIELIEEDFGSGEELYLSDNVREPMAKTAVQYTSVVDKLARNNVELQKKKMDKREQEKILGGRMPCLPPMPSFDIDNIKLDKNPERPLFKFKFFLQEVPSFERLLTILDSEDRCDPRYRRSKQMTRKVANRYNLTKEALHQRTLETAELNTNLKKRMEVLKKIQGGSGKRDIKDTKSKCHMMHKASSSAAAVPPKHGKPIITNIINLDDVVSPMAAKVRGITDSRICENHVLDTLGKKKGGKARKKSKAKSVSISPSSPTTYPPPSPKTTPDIVVTSPSGQSIVLQNEKSEPAVPTAKDVSPRSRPTLPKDQKSVASKKSIRKKESKAGEKKSVSKARSVSSRAGSKNKGRASVAASYTETETSEEEDDALMSSCFDTKKLNFRYSFEKLKGSKNPKKKRPAFYDILKKYYRVQKTLDALTKPKGSKGKGRKSIFERILQKQSIKPKSESIIGKLKKFPFLQYKKRYIFPVEMANFATVSMAEFEEKLFQALDDFIVRKEHVVSNINGKSVTTITFTKKSTYDQKNWHY